MNNRPAHFLIAITSIGFVTVSATCGQTLSKVDRLLQQDGFQLQAAIDPSNPFHFSTHVVNGQTIGGLTQANYTAPSWAGSALFTDWDGLALNGPWSVWNVNLGGSGNNFPDQVPADGPHLSKLVSMAIDDEVEWESNSSIEANLISQFQYAESQSAYNNVILSTNNSLGQLGHIPTVPGGIAGFIQQAQPDMLTFDTYPFTNGNAAATDDSQILNVGYNSWYTGLRFYRNLTLDYSYQPSNPNYGIEFGIYRQIYATSGDGTRASSGTEYAVETFTAMAFNAKLESDFIYNDGASTLFTHGDGTAETAFYSAVQRVNSEAANLGRTMVYLTSISAGTNPDPNWDDGTNPGTPDILFLRGQQVNGNATTPNPLPNGFRPSSSNAFSAWTQGVNDPWMTGFGQANIGGKVGQYINASGNPAAAAGDALVSWFRPLGEDQATATSKGDIYFMIVNAFSTPTASPGDCLQNIHLDFGGSGAPIPLGPGQTIPSIQYIDPITGQVVTLYEDQTGMKVTNATIEPAGTVLLTNTLGNDTNGTGKLRLSVYLNGGDAFIFKFNYGTPFLVPEPGTLSLIGIGALGMLRRAKRK